MVTLAANATQRDGVTLVTATLEGGHQPVRVRIENRLDGSIWPPRRQGVPAAGWDGEGFEGVVPADGRLAIGFASPADPVDPPVAVTATSPADDWADADGGMKTPAAVVRGLGDPSPPSPAVAAGTDRSPTDGAAYIDDRRAAVGPPPIDDREEASSPPADSGAGSVDATTRELPPELTTWLTTVEQRLDRAERLQADATVERATAALRECGGVDGARTLADRLSADARTLRDLEDRAGALADRADETAVATDALDRLA